MSRPKRNRALSLAVLALGFCGATPAWAAVTPGGDTIPSTSTSYIVGNTGSGTLAIDDGSSLSVLNGYLGYAAGASGAATVSGAGSKWRSDCNFCVGRGGTGTLTIAAGAQVLSSELRDGYTAYLAYEPGSVGTAIVNGTGSAWNHAGPVHIGSAGVGTLRIEAGGQVTNAAAYAAYIAEEADSIGTAIVSGNGSEWTNGTLHVGSSGSGTLRVEAGGQVNCTAAYVGSSSGPASAAIVTGTGSTWTSQLHLFIPNGTLTVADGGLVIVPTLYASPNDLHGDGTIRANGAVLDADVVFDKSRGTTVAFGSSGVLSLTLDGTGELGAGYQGSGSLRIMDGVKVTSSTGYLGRYSGADGTATVSGAGSSWTNTGTLNVGNMAGNARGSLHLSDGGQVIAKTAGVGINSILRLHLSGDDMLVLGSASSNGTLANSGTVNFYVDAFLPAGTYRPISAYPGKTMNLSGGGQLKAFGSTSSFVLGAINITVAEPTQLQAGASDSVTAGERLLVTDDATGHRLGVSYATNVGTFSAKALSDSKTSSLMALLQPQDAVLDAWEFTSAPLGEAMLAFEIGADANDLHIWRQLGGGSWSPYTPSMQTYDANGIFSFTVDGLRFTSFAVTAAVPEPGTMGLLALAGSVVLIRRRVRG